MNTFTFFNYLHFHFYFQECACWWDITRNDCACCKKGVGAMQCGYSNLYLYLYLHLSLYLRLYLYFIDLIFSPRPHFWHNLLFFVWILPLQKLLQVPNAQVLLQEVWQWLPWGVQLQVHPLRKRLPLLLWPLQVSVIILCYSGWHLVIRLSVCLSKVILSNPKPTEWLMSTLNFLGSSWVLIFQHWLCLVQQNDRCSHWIILGHP